MFSVTSINRMSLHGEEEGLRLGMSPPARARAQGEPPKVPGSGSSDSSRRLPSHSHLRLCVLDSRALPVQEAVLGVDHLLGLAGLLKGGFQLHGYVLAHCGKERAQAA